MPCTFNLRRLAANVKEGNSAAGGTPLEFTTIAISNGVTIVCYVDRSTSAMLIVAGGCVLIQLAAIPVLVATGRHGRGDGLRVTE